MLVQWFSWHSVWSIKTFSYLHTVSVSTNSLHVRESGTSSSGTNLTKTIFLLSCNPRKTFMGFLQLRGFTPRKTKAWWAPFRARRSSATLYSIPSAADDISSSKVIFWRRSPATLGSNIVWRVNKKCSQSLFLCHWHFITAWTSVLINSIISKIPLGAGTPVLLDTQCYQNSCLNETFQYENSFVTKTNVYVLAFFTEPQWYPKSSLKKHPTIIRTQVLPDSKCCWSPTVTRASLSPVT